MSRPRHLRRSVSWRRQPTLVMLLTFAIACGLLLPSSSVAAAVAPLLPGPQVSRVDLAKHEQDLQTDPEAKAGGDARSVGGAIDRTGRYVAFTSISTNLTSDATAGMANVFVYDRQTRKTLLVSWNEHFGRPSGCDSQGGEVVKLSDTELAVTYHSLDPNMDASDPIHKELFSRVELSQEGIVPTPIQYTVRVTLDEDGAPSARGDIVSLKRPDGKKVTGWDGALDAAGNASWTSDMWPHFYLMPGSADPCGADEDTGTGDGESGESGGTTTSGLDPAGGAITGMPPGAGAVGTQSGDDPVPPGELDPAFGVGGTATFHPGGGTTSSGFVQLAEIVVTASRVLAVGLVSTSSGTQGYVAALDAQNGSLVPAFGDGGIQRFTGMSAVTSAAVAPNGDIYVGGTAFESGTFVTRLAVKRFAADGTPDLTYGAAGLATVPGYRSATGGAIALQADGKVVIAGGSVPDTGLAEVVVTAGRLRDDGSADTSFGPIGTGAMHVQTSAGAVRSSRATDLKVTGDGSMVLAVASRGQSTFTEDKFGMVKLSVSGLLDPAFGFGLGHVTYDAAAPGESVVQASPTGVDVDESGGRYVLTANALMSSFIWKPQVKVVDWTTGLADTTFGGDGGFGGFGLPLALEYYYSDVTVLETEGDPAYRISGYRVATEESGRDILLGALTYNGSLDLSWGLGLGYKLYRPTLPAGAEFNEAWAEAVATGAGATYVSGVHQTYTSTSSQSNIYFSKVRDPQVYGEEIDDMEGTLVLEADWFHKNLTPTGPIPVQLDDYGLRAKTLTGYTADCTVPANVDKPTELDCLYRDPEGEPVEAIPVPATGLEYEVYQDTKDTRDGDRANAGLAAGFVEMAPGVEDVDEGEADTFHEGGAGKYLVTVGGSAEEPQCTFARIGDLDSEPAPPSGVDHTHVEGVDGESGACKHDTASQHIPNQIWRTEASSPMNPELVSDVDFRSPATGWGTNGKNRPSTWSDWGLIDSRHSTIADTGSIGFTSIAGNLPGDCAGDNVHVHDGADNTNQCVSSPHGKNGVLSQDGHTIVFESNAPLLPEDTGGGDDDIYARHNDGGAPLSSSPLELITDGITVPDTAPPLFYPTPDTGWGPSVSRDGSTIAWVSRPPPKPAEVAAEDWLLPAGVEQIWTTQTGAAVPEQRWGDVADVASRDLVGGAGERRSWLYDKDADHLDPFRLAPRRFVSEGGRPAFTSNHPFDPPVDNNDSAICTDGDGSGCEDVFVPLDGLVVLWADYPFGRAGFLDPEGAQTNAWRPPFDRFEAVASYGDRADGVYVTGAKIGVRLEDGSANEGVDLGALQWHCVPVDCETTDDFGEYAPGGSGAPGPVAALTHFGYMSQDQPAAVTDVVRFWHDADADDEWDPDELTQVVYVGWNPDNTTVPPFHGGNPRTPSGMKQAPPPD